MAPYWRGRGLGLVGEAPLVDEATSFRNCSLVTVVGVFVRRFRDLGRKTDEKRVLRLGFGGSVSILKEDGRF
jgi:hypothetical protein